ncbi:MAG: hypothetical protein ACTSO7_07020 [Candidatus Heimdallarchaeota archaeon]
MSKSKNTKEKKSVISVRALCEVCKKSDEFQISTKDLLPHIGGLYQVSTIHHCAENKDMIMNLVLDRNYAVRQSSVSPFVAEVEDNKWLPERVKDIGFLVRTIKDADRVVHAVLANKQVIIASNNRSYAKRIVNTLDLFSPTKYSSIIEWTENVNPSKKIIGTTPKFVSSYKGAVTVNLDKNKTNNGKSSNYCRDLLEYLITLEPEGMAYAARLKIAMLVEFAKMLAELIKEPDIGQKAIDLVKMDVSADAYELIVDILSGFDPNALEIVKDSWL